MLHPTMLNDVGPTCWPRLNRPLVLLFELSFNPNMCIPFFSAQVFGTDSGRRSNTPSTLVVLQLGEDRPGADAASVKRSSEGLQKDGVRIYVIGVGSSVSRNDLAAFASSNSDVLHLPSLADSSIAKKLIDTLCEGMFLSVMWVMVVLYFCCCW